MLGLCFNFNLLSVVGMGWMIWGSFPGRGR